MYIHNHYRHIIHCSGYLRSTEGLTFDNLIFCADHDGVARTTLEELARLGNVTVKTLKKYIKLLEGKGVITEKALHKEKGESETTCIYELNLDIDFWKDKAKTVLEEHPRYLKTLNSLDLHQFSHNQEKFFEMQKRGLLKKQMKYIVNVGYTDGAYESYYRDTLEQCYKLEHELLKDSEVEIIHVPDEPQEVELMP